MNDDPRMGLASASKFERLVNCPGSQRLEATVTDIDESDADAERGTKIHRAFETGNTIELDEEEAEAYRAGVKFTEMLVNAWKDQWNIISQQEGPREQRLWFHHPDTLDPLASAQLDRNYIAPPYALVVDLKSGWATHIQPAPKSWQLRFQALCLWKDRDDIHFIRVAHARALSKVGANDYCDYTEDDLRFSEQSILYRLWEASRPDAPCHAGHWCSYCKAKAFCPEAGAHSMLPSVIAGRAVQIESKEDAELAVATLAPADLLKVWQVSGVVTKIVEAVKRRLKGMTEAELAELGLALFPGMQLDPITGTEACFKFLKDVQNWNEADLWAALTFSKGKLAAIARKEKGLSSDEKAKGWIKQALAEYITPQQSEAIIRKV